MSYPIGKILTSRPYQLIHIIIGGGSEKEIPILPLIYSYVRWRRDN
jgi:hypothetical protein